VMLCDNLSMTGNFIMPGDRSPRICSYLSVLLYCVACCSELSDSSTPATVKQRLAAHKLDQTKPDDPKFVGRLKTLNLGVLQKHHSSRGLSLM